MNRSRSWGYLEGVVVWEKLEVDEGREEGREGDG
jgi:hypothetical protein